MVSVQNCDNGDICVCLSSETGDVVEANGRQWWE